MNNLFLTKNLYSLLGKKLFGSAGIQFLGAGLLFVMHVMLANFMSPSNYGAVVYFLAWINLVSSFSKFGCDRALVRYISRAKAIGDFNRLIIEKASIARMAVYATTLSLLLIIPIFWYVNTESVFSLQYIIEAMIVILPLTVYGFFQKGILVGLGDVIISKVPTEIIKPLLIIFLLLAWSSYFEDLSPINALRFFGLSLIISLLIGYVFERYSLHNTKKICNSNKKVSEPVARFKDVRPFVMVSAAQNMMRNTDIILLGLIAGPEAVAIYSVAARISNLTIFIQRAASPTIQPYLSNAWTQKDYLKLSRIINFSVIIIFLLTITASFIIFISRHFLLGIFGDEYQVAAIIMSILIIAQILNVACGFGGALLPMTDNQATAGKIYLSVLIFNIIANTVLIYYFDALGASIATGFSIVFLNILFVYFCVKKLNLNPSFLGALVSIYNHKQNNN